MPDWLNSLCQIGLTFLCQSRPDNGCYINMPIGYNVMSNGLRVFNAHQAFVMPIRPNVIFLCPMGLKFRLCQTGITLYQIGVSFLMPLGLSLCQSVIRFSYARWTWVKFLLCQTGIRVMPEWGSLVMPNGHNTLMRDWHIDFLCQSRIMLLCQSGMASVLVSAGPPAPSSTNKSN